VSTKKNNILIITSWCYNDALIQTYTLPYLKIISKKLPEGSKIYLVTLEKNKTKNILSEYGIINISIPYTPFGFRAIFRWMKNIIQLLTLIIFKNISTIHAWCTPSGMIAYILSVLTGKTLIIDSYEPHAEAMVENGEWKKDSFAFKLLFNFEKLQTKRAKYLIATTEGMKNYSKIKYNHTKDNFFVKPACVNLQMFSKEKIKNKKLLSELNLENKIVCVYAGKFGGIYLEKEVFEFIKEAEKYWGAAFRTLILSSNSSDYIKQMAVNAGINENTIIHQFVSHNQIPDYMGLADFAITPVKPVPTKRYCTPIKDGEYWALGLPVVITANISDDSDIINEYKIGSVFKNLNTEDYQNSIKEIDNLLKNSTRMELYNKIRPIAEKYRNFEIAEHIYSEIYGKK
jgi:glycosyltransferase involved in cell wall biosynthesis